MRVLLVDDEESMQTVMAGFLRRYCAERDEPFEFTGLADPVKGLYEASAHGEAYDLILLDVRLPRMTGDEIYQALEQTRPELLGRILFVTGYRNDLEDRLPVVGLRVLEKPFSFEELVEQLDAMRAAGA
ncbi:MAG: response regulator [Mariprofundaceae bacterium]